MVERTGQLKGWRCRACGSWDIYAAILGNVQRGTSQASREKGLEQGMSLKTSGKDANSRNSSVSPQNDSCFHMCSPPCSKDLQVRRLAHTSVYSVGSPSPSENQFQALGLQRSVRELP